MPDVRGAPSRFAAFARSAPDRAREAGGRALRPERFQDKADKATRTGQVVALLTTPILIIISLALITAFNEAMAGVFGLAPPGAEQTSIFAFLITLITAGTLVFAIWAWFQYVRTAAFGMFLLE